MIITFVSIVVAILAIVFVAIADWDELDWKAVVGMAVSVIGGVALIGCLAQIITAPISIHGDLADYRALETSLSLARANDTVSPVELAAIQQDVMAFNRQLARDQYWAKNPWTNWFYSKRIFEMTPIR